ncbi:polysaccharide deacetylase family protein [Pseudoflavitalea sp. X16]|uniref:polysaccharide deacetylase family protein n=1 Tax=Paraflavitalea devenefica TaxID=2716334 RepID=UPI0014247BB5|nr:polysaccharide deacetylase family protein [Paraflavitalea devenefica]NII27401.1 polysaccharide deacetylase family protein [Paraflavitalea devenefica]
MEGIFTISLDFELHWGVFDKKDRQKRAACYRNTLQLIPRMLEQFAAANVHVTWATVGSLFAKDQQEWELLKPAIEPGYSLEQYSAYRWVAQHGLSPQYHWAHFAPQTIKEILRYPGQELGSHTFSHFYCLEQQHEPMAFEADCRAAQRAAALFNTKLTSLVFPRNQFNPAYLKTCFEQGITTIRTNPVHWFWSPVSNRGAGILRKIMRTADAYIQVGGTRTSYPLSSVQVIPGEPLRLPASRFLRPWRSEYRFANKWRLRRLCQELRTAAIRKECYHLWWHPENFGDHPEENMESLRILLQQYTTCREQYGMKSWNMGEYATHLFGVSQQNCIQSHVGATSYPQ